MTIQYFPKNNFWSDVSSENPFENEVNERTIENRMFFLNDATDKNVNE